MDDRKQKLAQALRDNLMRRKQQARARAKGDADGREESADPERDGRKKATLSGKSDAALG